MAIKNFVRIISSFLHDTVTLFPLLLNDNITRYLENNFSKSFYLNR